MHVIAAKAVAFGEALRPDFKIYARRVVENAKALAEAMVAGGLDLVSGGTDNHLLLVDLRPKRLTGRAAEDSLERAGITCNMNGIPFDPEKPTVTSGIRLGSPAATTRGFGLAEFQRDRAPDRRGAGRPRRQPRRQPRRRGPRAGRGRGAVRPVPGL